MKLHTTIAIGLVCVSPGLGLAEARAEDEPLPRPVVSWTRPADATRAASDLSLPFTLPATSAANLLMLTEAAAPTTKEIRLSHGAKVAIIVTAIVVGALIIVGLVAVGHPHGPF